jgi:hypothetical protein
LKADPNNAAAHEWLAARKAPAGEIQPVEFRVPEVK